MPPKWKLEPCRDCGRHQRVHRRLPDGQALCQACGRQPPEPCGVCGRTAPVAARPDGKPHCPTCYDRNLRPERTCGGCGQVTAIDVRARDGRPDLCRRCWQAQETVCSACGRIRPCTRISAGAPICGTCRKRTIRQAACSLCQQVRRISARWPLGSVCATCYNHVRGHPAPCTECGQIRPLTGRTEHGEPLCGQCSGARNAYLCPTCGSGEETDRHGRCARCVLRDRLANEFTGPDGTTPTQLTPLVEALVRVGRARSILTWLSKPHGGAQLLRDLAASGTELTHEALDAEVNRPAAVTLRATLVHLGLLPERHEDLERLEPWLERKTADAPPEYRSLLRAYGSWVVVRDARRRAERTRFTRQSLARKQNHLLSVIAFLTWTTQTGLALDAVTQRHIDDWLDGSGPTRRSVRGFLRWTCRRGLTADLDVPGPRKAPEPRDWSTPEQRWELLNRCLHDDSLPLDVRAAGCLTLLYGITGPRLTELTTRHLTGGSHPTIQLGEHPAALPPAAFQLLAQQAEHAVTASAIARATPRPRTPWLFPGQLADRPVTAHHLTGKLRRYGLPVIPLRNSALISLAADLPPSVLSSLLGISLTSALQWTRRAGRDWNAYLASRA
ncbi:hypothetical protein ACIRST_37820 [Kitasatospora sp. NPDC101447]|uniref:hypothetical protein n=1 Tax=Kitasatospora sp. NPDC101447 TaxID=3364102 RepID=UPI00380FD77C